MSQIKRWVIFSLVSAFLSSLVCPTGAQSPATPSTEHAPAQIVVGGQRVKPHDAPNPFDYRRLQRRERLLTQGRGAEAASLALAGQDRVLVILVEFGGEDVVTWSPGDSWDPLGDPATTAFIAAGDCSGVINTPRTFHFAGPLHNQLVKPTSAAHPAYNSIWRDDFSPAHYAQMLFGDGAFIRYTMDDGQAVTIDLRGYSLRSYYEEQSQGRYSVTGDVIGWVAVPHSQAWYGADLCPGARSANRSSLADGAFPNGGSPQSLARDAVDAAVAAYPQLDWAQYDRDGNGVLDRLMIVHAGYGEEENPVLLRQSGVGEHALWSHSWTVWPFHPVGDTGLFVGPYTMMPENGSTGVFAHELAHSLGAIDLYAYQGGETSAGFWSLMADDWPGGWPASAIPPGLDPWHKYLLGWNDPLLLDRDSTEATVVLGQASRPPEDTVDCALIDLPDQVEQPVSPPNGSFMWWSGREDYYDARLTLATPLDLRSARAASLTFRTFYDIEQGWDFGFVQASTDGGMTWASLPGTSTTSEHKAESWFATEMPGYTGSSRGWSEETVDLGDYLGQENVLLRFRYETDPNTLGLGWFLDDVTINADGQAVQFDGAESEAGLWLASDWSRFDGRFKFANYYLAEWRNAAGFDAGLASGRYGVQDWGMLLWYRNAKYTDNEIATYLAEPPAFGPKGACLLVDAHPEPFRVPNSPYNNEVANLSGRQQMRDACFGLRDTQPFDVLPPGGVIETAISFASRPAVAEFHDCLGYYPGLELVPPSPSRPALAWCTIDWDASCVLPARGSYGVAPTNYPLDEPLRFDGQETAPGLTGWWWYPAGIGYSGSTGNPGADGYGVHVQVIAEAADLSWGKVRIHRASDTITGRILADRRVAAPGDFIRYRVELKDAAHLARQATLAIPIPRGTQFVPGSLSAGAHLADGGTRITWGGSVGGSTLHVPDVAIEYQVRVDPGQHLGIISEAWALVAEKSYHFEVVTLTPWIYLPIVTLSSHP